jgi:hypothetical protein
MNNIAVTIGGWMVTFIVEKRGGGGDAGYVSSGFFGGEASPGAQTGKN